MTTASSGKTGENPEKSQENREAVLAKEAEPKSTTKKVLPLLKTTSVIVSTVLFLVFFLVAALVQPAVFESRQGLITRNVVLGILLFLVGLAVFHALTARLMEGVKFDPKYTPSPKSNSNLTTKSDGRPPAPDLVKELLVLEYQNAVGRYENLYKAIWQNFSYLSVVAGVLLTFGSKALSISVVSLLALSPLLFWFLATFLPMDYYGQRARARLGQIERELTNKYFAGPGLGHFTDFATLEYRWHVGEAVKGFGLVVSLCWCISFAFASSHAWQTFKKPEDDVAGQKKDSLTVAITHIPERDTALHTRIGEVDSALGSVSLRIDSLLKGELRLPAQKAGAVSGTSRRPLQ
jgi:hypothetical protein